MACIYERGSPHLHLSAKVLNLFFHNVELRLQPTQLRPHGLHLTCDRKDS